MDPFRQQFGHFWARLTNSQIGQWLLVGAAYYVAGRLALLLAIPPGYATGIWPGAGIALAAVLICGYRICPVIVLASFLINFRTFLDGTPALSLFKAGLPALSIGVGAAFQASLGAFLVRRFVGFPTTLSEPKEVLRFMLLGSASCLVSATVGVTTLVLGGTIRQVDAPFSWGTWWVGDAIGVIVFAPLILLWAAARSPASQRHRRIWVSLPLALSFALVVVLFTYASAWEQRRIKLEFDRRTDHLVQSLDYKFNDYLEILHSIKSFHEGSPGFDRGGFRTFVQRFFPRHPGIHAVSWNVLITDADRAAYEEAGRREFSSGFQITELDAQKRMVRAAQRPEYLSVRYVEPFAGNEAALGFDAFSSSDRLEALAQSRDTGKAVATGPITLAQDSDGLRGLLVFLPIYRLGVPHATLAERRKNLQGYATAAFQINEMMRAALKNLDQQGIKIWLCDDSAPESERVIYGAGSPPSRCGGNAAKLNTAQIQRSLHYEMVGRQWTLEFALKSKYLIEHRSWAAWTVLAGGLLFTGLLGAFLLVITGHTDRVEEQVARRTLELQCANHQIQKLNEHLEQRVTQRTAQLNTINQDLRQQITAREQVETQLRQAGVRLQALSGRVVKVQEMERRHLARELHDEIGQALTATKINLQAALRFPEPDSLAGRLADSIELVDRLLQQVRALSLDLRPPMLDDLGLVAALRWYVDQQTQRAGLQERFVAQGLEQRLDPALEAACFRVAQEAITNVVRHARAETLTVELRCQGNHLHLSVSDDGVGFEVTAAKARAERGESLGLAGMEERVSLAGGEFICTSAPHEGTELHASFPIKPVGCPQPLQTVVTV